MVIVSEGMFNKAVREYAGYALPKTPIGEVWTYFTHKDERVGMICGHKYWLEDDIVRKMSTVEGQTEG